MLFYLAIGAAALALIFWTGGGKLFPRREWRLMAGALALAAFSAAAFVGLRGGWGKAIVLVVVGLWLAASARGPGPAQARAQTSDRPETSIAEARSILGVGPEATPEQIRAAHGRLMKLAHPDKGGTSGLAAQLNAARDRLLKP